MALAACAAPGPEGPPPAPVEAPPPAHEAAAALRAAEELHEAGRHGEAASRADSLYAAWDRASRLGSLRNRALWLEARAREAIGQLGEARDALATLLDRLDGPSPLRPRAASRLAALLHATGEDAEALRVLLETPEAVGEAELAVMREAALRTNAEELRRLALRHPLGESLAAILLHAELARSLALAGSLDSARGVARRVAARRPAGTPEGDLARRLAALDDDAVRRATVGVVLPLSGRFSAVGRLLEEGMRLALEEHRRERPEAIQVELRFEDDASSPDRAIAAAARLEEAGALAILGPVRSEPFAAAVRARRNPRLLLVSPTATRPLPAPAAYSLWAREPLERQAAGDVGAWIVRELGLARTAVLFPSTPGGSAAVEGFDAGVRSRGGEVVAVASYHPDSTSFEGPIGQLAEARPDAVFVAAPSAPAVLQIAPQLHYFGLDRSVVAGGPAWADPAVVRRLDPFDANYRIVGAQVDRTAEDGPWARFRDLYEGEYRKPLQGNILPALGYDAVKLVLAAVEEARLPLPGAVSRAAEEIGPVRGATGALRPEPESSSVARTTLIRVLLDGRLVPPEPAAVLTWLERARFRADSIAEAVADSIARARAGEEPPPRP